MHATDHASSRIVGGGQQTSGRIRSQRARVSERMEHRDDRTLDMPVMCGSAPAWACRCHHALATAVNWSNCTPARRRRRRRLVWLSDESEADEQGASGDARSDENAGFADVGAIERSDR